MSFKEMLTQPLPSHGELLVSLDFMTVGDDGIFFLEDNISRSTIKSVGNVTFSVYHEDTAVPHFHIFNRETEQSKRVDTCLKLDSGEYFLHGAHNTSFTDKQLKYVYNFLKNYTPKIEKNDDCDKSLWEMLQFVWNENASTDCKSTAKEIPDYRNANKNRKKG